MTFDWQENDIKMAQFMFNKMEPIAKAMNPKHIIGSPKNADSHFDTTSYQTTHMNGGAVMGKIRRPARLTVTCKAGMYTMCSLSARRPSLRGWATTRPAPLRRWRTGLRARFANSI